MADAKNAQGGQYVGKRVNEQENRDSLAGKETSGKNLTEKMTLTCVSRAVSRGRERKKVEDSQSCRTLCDPMDCRPPASSVLGILHARILEWVACSRGSSQPRDRTQVSRIAGGFFTSWAPRKPKNAGVGSLSLLQDLPHPGISPRSPALQADSLPAEPPAKPRRTGKGEYSS